MKQFFTLLATALLAVLPLSATQTTEPVKNETREYKLSGFSGLEVSWIYKVELTQSSRYAVSVEAPDFLMEYILVEVRNGRLILGVGEMPNDVRRRVEKNGNHYDVRAYVSMPELSSLQASGASRLTVRGEFSTLKPFELRASGASQVRDLSVKAPSADIEVSGASKVFDLNGKFDKFSLRGSGSANITMAGDAKTVDLRLSGASKLSLKGKLGDVDLQGSGAANIELDGNIESLTAEGSGSTKLLANRAPARRVRISLSGASNAMIEVREELSVNLSGASKLNYHPGPALRITSQSISRASTLSSF